MATWNGTPKKFEVEFCTNNYYDTRIDDVIFSWSYNTTADILEIKTEHPDMDKIQSNLTGPDWARAELYMLADWMATYNSVDELKELLKPILEKDEPWKT